MQAAAQVGCSVHVGAPDAIWGQPGCGEGCSQGVVDGAEGPGIRRHTAGDCAGEGAACLSAASPCLMMTTNSRSQRTWPHPGPIPLLTSFAMVRPGPTS